MKYADHKFITNNEQPANLIIQKALEMLLQYTDTLKHFGFDLMLATLKKKKYSHTHDRQNAYVNSISLIHGYMLHICLISKLDIYNIFKMKVSILK